MQDIAASTTAQRMPAFLEALTRAARALSDDQLTSELACAERCARLATRTRRDLWMARIRCIRCELERRSAERSGTNPWLGG